jgi:hypothetical protein
MENFTFLIAFVASLIFMVYANRKLKSEFAEFLERVKIELNTDKDEAVKSLDKCISLMREK